MLLFGPAGCSDSFEKMGYKNTLQVPEYLEKMGLDAFEYQCGRGVKISDESARKFGEAAKEKGIRISLHAPYFISMSSVEEEKRDNSVRYIMQSANAVNQMQGNRIVVHTGSCGKMSREKALELAKNTMCKAIDELDNAGLGHIHICPELMGKINQLGTLDEVIELCLLDERLIPCIDFGHFNARTFGGLKGYSDYAYILDTLENKLGKERGRNIHAHFSKIEFTEKGGEKKHLTFDDTVYGPEFAPLAQLFAERDYSAVIICESAGTQAEDALTMKNLWNKAKESV